MSGWSRPPLVCFGPSHHSIFLPRCVLSRKWRRFATRWRSRRGHPRDGHRADGGEAQDRGAAEGARQGACVVTGFRLCFFPVEGKHAEEGAEGARQGASGAFMTHSSVFFLFFRRRLHQTLTCASMSSIFLQLCSCSAIIPPSGGHLRSIGGPRRPCSLL